MSQLTLEALRKAVEMLKTRAIEPHYHVVHPKRLSDRRVRWISCAICFATLDKKRAGLYD